MADTRAWRVVPGQSLACHEWDGEAVLFNSLSGATHLLSPAALWLLEILAPGPASTAALMTAVWEEGAEPEQLLSLLDELKRLYLVEPC